MTAPHPSRDHAVRAHLADHFDLRHHGDREVGAGLVDLAVNVRRPAPPPWLVGLLTRELEHLAAYPDTAAATAAVARRHGRGVDEVLVTSGGAEAFTLLARALRPGADVRHAVVVHPQFTEPEVALDVAGHRVHRVVLRPQNGFALEAGDVPDEADLVVVGNPTNPTSVLHPAQRLRALARPGRVLVVDEAFMDAVPGELESLAARSLPGVVVLRSLTKTWGLAGLRAGYLLGPPELVRRCADVQPPWSVSSLALAATEACCAPEAVDEAQRAAADAVGDRTDLQQALADLPGVTLPVAQPGAPFILFGVPQGDRVRQALRHSGFTVRRGGTFPGLGPDWLRVAVRDTGTGTAFVRELARVLGAV
ncbi:MAG TPA: Rv2231c family pyridoxal phosphate-dependent protein CobC [Actinomycetales bacterium]|jgi:histidinol-phosphate aminotransferase